jgi:hypothetical protein
MSSYSLTTTFTRTHAREIASRVAADLRLMHRYYGAPALDAIDAYETEFVELLVGGYLRQVEYGFKRDGQRVVSLRYTVRAGSGEPERAGGVFATANTDRARFFSFLKYSDKYLNLTAAQQAAIVATLPFERTYGSEPGNGTGHWVTDRAYGAGGVLAGREMFRPAA